MPESQIPLPLRGPARTPYLQKKVRTGSRSSRSFWRATHGLITEPWKTCSRSASKDEVILLTVDKLLAVDRLTTVGVASTVDGAMTVVWVTTVTDRQLLTAWRIGNRRQMTNS